jgi:hypothetical protein
MLAHTGVGIEAFDLVVRQLHQDAMHSLKPGTLA